MRKTPIRMYCLDAPPNPSSGARGARRGPDARYPAHLLPSRLHFGAVLRLWCVTLAVTAAAACGGTDPRPASWGYLHAAIVAPSCATVGCHSDLSMQGELSLEDVELARAALIERRHVVPGDPLSPLMYQLEGIERRRMPPDAPLPSADVELIRRWIVEGAGP